MCSKKWQLIAQGAFIDGILVEALVRELQYGHIQVKGDVCSRKLGFGQKCSRMLNPGPGQLALSGCWSVGGNP